MDFGATKRVGRGQWQKKQAEIVAGGRAMWKGRAVYYLRSRETGFLWNGAGWSAIRVEACGFNTADAAMDAARGISFAPLELVLFRGDEEWLVFPLQPVRDREDWRSDF